jgi:hypothetical protein
MPFFKTASCSEEEWTRIFEKIIKPTVEGSGLDYICHRSTATRGNIVKDIMRDLWESFVVIADLTDKNANVYYELGIRHALRNRTILISQNRDDIPFDLNNYANYVYEWKTEKGRKSFIDHVIGLLLEIENNPERDDNPVSDFLLEYIRKSEEDNVKKPSPTSPRILRPKIGAYDIPIQPVFSWSTVMGAIDYELVLSEDPTFTLIEWAVNTGENTSYQSLKDLRSYTTYYWKVRAVIRDKMGPWTVGIFTTQGNYQ